MTTTTTKKRLGSSYRKLFISTTISNIGDGMSLIAYPWLASALTRNPLLIAGVALVQRLPWLIFTLPAGVITDRVDRKRAMVVADFARFGLTLVVALAVLSRQGTLPGADELSKVTGTSTGLYILLLVATLLLGTGEVLRDNCGQTFMPSIVEVDQLEKANGRMWSAEGIANTFIGPPLGSLLLIAAFSLPFFVDAASFFAAAALVWSIPGSFRAERPDDHVERPWKVEMAEGFRWLWSNELLRSMAIILGLMNLASGTQRLGARALRPGDPRRRAVRVHHHGLRLRRRRGGRRPPGAAAVEAIRQWHVPRGRAGHECGGVVRRRPVVVVAARDGGLRIRGNRRRDLERDHRQFASVDHPAAPSRPRQQRLPLLRLGMMPIGAALGGVTVTVVSHLANRRIALRSAFFVDAAIYLCLFIIGRSRLTTAKLEAARTAVPA